MGSYEKYTIVKWRFHGDFHDFMVTQWDFMGSNGLYPLVNVYTTMENHHFSFINTHHGPFSMAKC